MAGNGHFDGGQRPFWLGGGAVMMLWCKVPRHRGRGRYKIFEVCTTIFLESKNSIKVRLLYQVLYHKGVWGTKNHCLWTWPEGNNLRRMLKIHIWVPMWIVSFNDKHQQRSGNLCRLLRSKTFFGEDGISNSIWIPSLVAVFPKTFWHYKKMWTYYQFFSVLEIEMLRHDPVTSVCPTNSRKFTSTLYHVVLHCITLYYIVLHYITLSYIVLHCVTLCYIVVHSST